MHRIRATLQVVPAALSSRDLQGEGCRVAANAPQNYSFH